jgi:carboxymethylenebutenolidase
MMDEARRRAAIALYDRFTHGGLDRRAFMVELTRLAGGGAAAALLLGSIAAQAAAQPQVAPDDRRLGTSEERIDLGGGASLLCYRARRTDRRHRTRPLTRSVIVIHENRGLNEHIRDVTRRLALEGYDSVAPDFLSLDGGATPADEDAARTAIGALDLTRATAAGAALVRRLHGQRQRLRGRERTTPVAVMGFCWGGAMTHRLALAAGPALAAAIPFYGPAPAPAEAARLQVPLLMILAGRDTRVNQTALPYAEAARAAGKDVRVINYPDVDHAFHNDTSAARYNETAARQAWAETIAFFAARLR